MLEMFGKLFFEDKNWSEPKSTLHGFIFGALMAGYFFAMIYVLCKIVYYMDIILR